MRKLVVATLTTVFLTLGQAQTNSLTQPTADSAYMQETVRLLTGLQKNPWLGWKSGTRVVIRYFDEVKPTTRPTTIQPDLVYEVVDSGKILSVTQEVNRKRVRRYFSAKDQTGLEAATIRTKGTTTGLELDGFTLSAVVSELWMDIFPGGSITTREWTLSDHASIVLRKESNGLGWQVTSTRVTKKIGDREFRCVEIKRRMSINSDGLTDVTTTQYLSPDIPGHLVEMVQEFVKVKQGKPMAVPDMVIHQKVVELTPP